MLFVYVTHEWKDCPCISFVAQLWRILCETYLCIWIDVKKLIICSTVFLQIPFETIFLWRCGPERAITSFFLRFLDYTQQHTTVGRTPLCEWSSRCRDLWQNLTFTADKHLCFRRDLNPWFQQASWRRPTPHTSRPMGRLKKPVSIFSVEEGVELVLDRKVCERRKKIKYTCSNLGQLNWSFIVGDGCHIK